MWGERLRSIYNGGSSRNNDTSFDQLQPIAEDLLGPHIRGLFGSTVRSTFVIILFDCVYGDPNATKEHRYEQDIKHATDNTIPGK